KRQVFKQNRAAHSPIRADNSSRAPSVGYGLTASTQPHRMNHSYLRGRWEREWEASTIPADATALSLSSTSVFPQYFDKMHPIGDDVDWARIAPPRITHPITRRFTVDLRAEGCLWNSNESLKMTTR